MKTEEKKSLSREEALIKILERFAKQMDSVESRLTAIENFQKELFYTAESAQPGQKEANTKLGELKNVMLRYHSEMGKIVSAQDRVDKNIRLMSGRQEASATRQADLLREQENLNKHFVGLSDRFKVQEKTTGELYGLSTKLEDNISRNIEGFGNRMSKLHGETEKMFTREQRDTHRRLDELKNETLRRMLAFDGIEESLAVLLVRTEPPEPKPPIWPVRLYRKLQGSLNLGRTRLKSKRNSAKAERSQRRADRKNAKNAAEHAPEVKAEDLENTDD